MIAKYLVCYKTKYYGEGNMMHIIRSSGRYKLRKPKPDLESIMNHLKKDYDKDFMIVSISEIK